MPIRSESELPSERHLTVGSVRVDSAASWDAGHESLQPRPRQAAFYYVLGALAILVIAGIGWLCIDYGVDTKVHVTAEVQTCARMRRAQAYCTVRLDTGAIVSLYMFRARPGQKVQLAQFRRAISGELYYKLVL